MSKPLIVFMLFLSLSLFSQSIIINTVSEEHSYTIEEVQNLYFEMDNLYIQTESQVENFLLEDIVSISFGDGTSAENVTIPLPFILNQNHPNPFNPDTSISFSLQNSGTVILEVYNLKGQKISTIVNKFLPSGNHKFEWNGNDNYGNKVSSGIYLYRLNMDNQAETKKMILLK